MESIFDSDDNIHMKNALEETHEALLRAYESLLTESSDNILNNDLNMCKWSSDELLHYGDQLLKESYSYMEEGLSCSGEKCNAKQNKTVTSENNFSKELTSFCNHLVNSAYYDAVKEASVICLSFCYDQCVTDLHSSHCSSKDEKSDELIKCNCQEVPCYCRSTPNKFEHEVDLIFKSVEEECHTPVTTINKCTSFPVFEDVDFFDTNENDDSLQTFYSFDSDSDIWSSTDELATYSSSGNKQIENVSSLSISRDNNSMTQSKYADKVESANNLDICMTSSIDTNDRMMSSGDNENSLPWHRAWHCSPSICHGPGYLWQQLGFNNEPYSCHRNAFKNDEFGCFFMLPNTLDAIENNDILLFRSLVKIYDVNYSLLDKLRPLDHCFSYICCQCSCNVCYCWWCESELSLQVLLLRNRLSEATRGDNNNYCSVQCSWPSVPDITLCPRDVALHPSCPHDYFFSCVSLDHIWHLTCNNCHYPWINTFIRDYIGLILWFIRVIDSRKNYLPMSKSRKNSFDSSVGMTDVTEDMSHLTKKSLLCDLSFNSVCESNKMSASRVIDEAFNSLDVIKDATVPLKPIVVVTTSNSYDILEESVAKSKSKRSCVSEINSVKNSFASELLNDLIISPNYSYLTDFCDVKISDENSTNDLHLLMPSSNNSNLDSSSKRKSLNRISNLYHACPVLIIDDDSEMCTWENLTVPSHHCMVEVDNIPFSKSFGAFNHGSFTTDSSRGFCPHCNTPSAVVPMKNSYHNFYNDVENCSKRNVFVCSSNCCINANVLLSHSTCSLDNESCLASFDRSFIAKTSHNSFITANTNTSVLFSSHTFNNCLSSPSLYPELVSSLCTALYNTDSLNNTVFHSSLQKKNNFILKEKEMVSQKDNYELKQNSTLTNIKICKNNTFKVSECSPVSDQCQDVCQVTLPFGTQNFCACSDDHGSVREVHTAPPYGALIVLGFVQFLIDQKKQLKYILYGSSKNDIFDCCLDKAVTWTVVLSVKNAWYLKLNSHGELVKVNQNNDMAYLQDLNRSRTLSPTPIPTTKVNGFTIANNEKTKVKNLLPLFGKETYLSSSSKDVRSSVTFRAKPSGVTTSSRVNCNSDVCDIQMYRADQVLSLPTDETKPDDDDNSHRVIKLCGIALGTHACTQDNNPFCSLPRSRVSSPTSPRIFNPQLQLQSHPLSNIDERTNVDKSINGPEYNEQEVEQNLNHNLSVNINSNISDDIQPKSDNCIDKVKLYDTIVLDQVKMEESSNIEEKIVEYAAPIIHEPFQAKIAPEIHDPVTSHPPPKLHEPLADYGSPEVHEVPISNPTPKLIDPLTEYPPPILHDSPLKTHHDNIKSAEGKLNEPVTPHPPPKIHGPSTPPTSKSLNLVQNDLKKDSRLNQCDKLTLVDESVKNVKKQAEDNKLVESNTSQNLIMLTVSDIKQSVTPISSSSSVKPVGMGLAKSHTISRMSNNNELKKKLKCEESSSTENLLETFVLKDTGHLSKCVLPLNENFADIKSINKLNDFGVHDLTCEVETKDESPIIEYPSVFAKQTKIIKLKPQLQVFDFPKEPFKEKIHDKKYSCDMKSDFSQSNEMKVDEIDNKMQFKNCDAKSGTSDNCGVKFKNKHHDSSNTFDKLDKQLNSEHVYSTKNKLRDHTPSQNSSSDENSRSESIKSDDKRTRSRSSTPKKLKSSHKGSYISRKSDKPSYMAGVLNSPPYFKIDKSCDNVDGSKVFSTDSEFSTELNVERSLQDKDDKETCKVLSQNINHDPGGVPSNDDKDPISIKSPERMLVNLNKIIPFIDENEKIVQTDTKTPFQCHPDISTSNFENTFEPSFESNDSNLFDIKSGELNDNIKQNESKNNLCENHTQIKEITTSEPTELNEIKPLKTEKISMNIDLVDKPTTLASNFDFMKESEDELATGLVNTESKINEDNVDKHEKMNEFQNTSIINNEPKNEQNFSIPHHETKDHSNTNDIQKRMPKPVKSEKTSKKVTSHVKRNKIRKDDQTTRSASADSIINKHKNSSDSNDQENKIYDKNDRASKSDDDNLNTNKSNYNRLLRSRHRKSLEFEKNTHSHENFTSIKQNSRHSSRSPSNHGQAPGIIEVAAAIARQHETTKRLYTTKFPMDIVCHGRVNLMRQKTAPPGDIIPPGIAHHRQSSLGSIDDVTSKCRPRKSSLGQIQIDDANYKSRTIRSSSTSRMEDIQTALWIKSHNFENNVSNNYSKSQECKLSNDTSFGNKNNDTEISTNKVTECNIDTRIPNACDNNENDIGIVKSSSDNQQIIPSIEIEETIKVLESDRYNPAELTELVDASKMNSVQKDSDSIIGDSVPVSDTSINQEDCVQANNELIPSTRSKPMTQLHTYLRSNKHDKTRSSSAEGRLSVKDMTSIPIDQISSKEFISLHEELVRPDKYKKMSNIDTRSVKNYKKSSLDSKLLKQASEKVASQIPYHKTENHDNDKKYTSNIIDKHPIINISNNVTDSNSADRNICIDEKTNHNVLVESKINDMLNEKDTIHELNDLLNQSLSKNETEKYDRSKMFADSNENKNTEVCNTDSSRVDDELQKLKDLTDNLTPANSSDLLINGDETVNREKKSPELSFSQLEKEIREYLNNIYEEDLKSTGNERKEIHEDVVKENICIAQTETKPEISSGLHCLLNLQNEKEKVISSNNSLPESDSKIQNLEYTDLETSIPVIVETFVDEKSEDENSMDRSVDSFDSALEVNPPQLNNSNISLATVIHVTPEPRHDNEIVQQINEDTEVFEDAKDFVQSTSLSDEIKTATFDGIKKESIQISRYGEDTTATDNRKSFDNLMEQSSSSGTQDDSGSSERKYDTENLASASSTGSEVSWSSNHGPVARRGPMLLDEEQIPSWNALLAVNAPDSDTDPINYDSEDDFDIMDAEMRRLEEKLRKFEIELGEPVSDLPPENESSKPRFRHEDIEGLRTSPLPTEFPPVDLSKTKHLSLMSKLETDMYIDSGGESSDEHTSCSEDSTDALFIKRKIKLKPGDRRCRSLHIPLTKNHNIFKTSNTNIKSNILKQSSETTLGTETLKIEETTQFSKVQANVQSDLDNQLNTFINTSLSISDETEEKYLASVAEEITDVEYEPIECVNENLNEIYSPLHPMIGVLWQDDDGMAAVDFDGLEELKCITGDSTLFFIFEDDQDDEDDVCEEIDSNLYCYDESLDHSDIDFIPQPVIRGKYNSGGYTPDTPPHRPSSECRNYGDKSFVSTFKNSFLKAAKYLGPKGNRKHPGSRIETKSDSMFQDYNVSTTEGNSIQGSRLTDPTPGSRFSLGKPGQKWSRNELSGVYNVPSGTIQENTPVNLLRDNITGNSKHKNEYLQVQMVSETSVEDQPPPLPEKKRLHLSIHDPHNSSNSSVSDAYTNYIQSLTAPPYWSTTDSCSNSAWSPNLASPPLTFSWETKSNSPKPPTKWPESPQLPPPPPPPPQEWGNPNPSQTKNAALRSLQRHIPSSKQCSDWIEKTIGSKVRKSPSFSSDSQHQLRENNSSHNLGSSASNYIGTPRPAPRPPPRNGEVLSPSKISKIFRPFNFAQGASHTAFVRKSQIQDDALRNFKQGTNMSPIFSNTLSEFDDKLLYSCGDYIEVAYERSSKLLFLPKIQEKAENELQIDDICKYADEKLLPNDYCFAQHGQENEHSFFNAEATSCGFYIRAFMCRASWPLSRVSFLMTYCSNITRSLNDIVSFPLDNTNTFTKSKSVMFDLPNNYDLSSMELVKRKSNSSPMLPSKSFRYYSLPNFHMYSHSFSLSSCFVSSSDISNSETSESVLFYSSSSIKTDSDNLWHLLKFSKSQLTSDLISDTSTSPKQPLSNSWSPQKISSDDDNENESDFPTDSNPVRCVIRKYLSMPSTTNDNSCMLKSRSCYSCPILLFVSTVCFSKDLLKTSSSESVFYSSKQISSKLKYSASESSVNSDSCY